MNKLEAGMIVFFTTMGILLTLNTIDMNTMITKLNYERDQCRIINQPQLNIKNEADYEHCINYPESYGVKMNVTYYAPWRIKE